MDQRDEKTWVIVELSHSGEARVTDGVFEKHLKRLIGKKNRDVEYELFVPSRLYERGGRKIALHLMEGYVFIDSDHPFRFFQAVEDTELVKTVMRTPSPSGIDTLHTLPNSEIERLQSQLREMVMKDLDEGITALVTKGVYKNLEGLVLGLHEENAIIRIELRTLSVITMIPQMFLDAANELQENST